VNCSAPPPVSIENPSGAVFHCFIYVRPPPLPNRIPVDPPAQFGAVVPVAVVDEGGFGVVVLAGEAVGIGVGQGTGADEESSKR
jgi:hypothetical protein